MRLVVTADWHADAHLRGVSRLDEIVKAANKAQTHAEIDRAWLLFAGDFADCAGMDERTPDIIYALTDGLPMTVAHIKQIAIAGNHDASSVGKKSLVSIMWPGCADEPCVVTTMDDWRLLALPYSFHHTQEDYEKEAQEYLDSLVIGEPGIVLSHLEFDGAVDGSERSMPRGDSRHVPRCLIEDERVVAIFNGHYHRPQRHGKIWVPGSPIRLRWDEDDDDERGFIVAEIEGGDVSVERA